jgi:hypothetical protein
MNELAKTTANDFLIDSIKRAIAIEQSEILALGRLSQSPGDYFAKSEVSVRSIASHWSKFISQPDIALCHPQQLEQACQQFTEYLETKKPYKQCGTKDIHEPIMCYVSDKLLEMAFKGGWLASDSVKRGVHNM